MKCDAVRELLSAYFDNELAESTANDVQGHLTQCASCRAKLGWFRELSKAAKHIASATSGGQSLATKRQPIATRRSFGKRALICAVTVVSLAVTAFVAHELIPHSHNHDHDEFTKDFGRYLDSFHTNSAAAQDFLLAKYPHQLVQPEDAEAKLGYRPAVHDGIPNDFLHDNTYVLDMPCCKCIQTVWRRSDRTVIVLFEHDDEETAVWFGKRPKRIKVVAGKPCSVFDIGSQLSASWKRGHRHLTVIGARDESELAQIVQWYGDGDLSEPPPAANHHHG